MWNRKTWNFSTTFRFFLKKRWTLNSVCKFQSNTEIVVIFYKIDWNVWEYIQTGWISFFRWNDSGIGLCAGFVQIPLSLGNYVPQSTIMQLAGAIHRHAEWLHHHLLLRGSRSSLTETVSFALFGVMVVEYCERSHFKCLILSQYFLTVAYFLGKNWYCRFPHPRFWNRFWNLAKCMIQAKVSNKLSFCVLCCVDSCRFYTLICVLLKQ